MGRYWLEIVIFLRGRGGEFGFLGEAGAEGFHAGLEAGLEAFDVAVEGDETQAVLVELADVFRVHEIAAASDAAGLGAF